MIAGDQRSGIAGAEVENGKHDDCNDAEHWHRGKDASPNIGIHGRSLVEGRPRFAPDARAW
jgi:hypothetical protein